MKNIRNGFSMMEMVVALAIFGILILILTSLEKQFVEMELRSRASLMKHPDASAVNSRVWKDILDSSGYPEAHMGFRQSPTVLLLSTNDAKGQPQIIVYDFRTGTTARRLTYRGDDLTGAWAARGVPRYRILSFEMPDGGVAVRLQAFDFVKTKSGTEVERLVLDQITEPRAGG